MDLPGKRRSLRGDSETQNLGIPIWQRAHQTPQCIVGPNSAPSIRAARRDDETSYLNIAMLYTYAYIYPNARKARPGLLQGFCLLSLSVLNLSLGACEN